MVDPATAIGNDHAKKTTRRRADAEIMADIAKIGPLPARQPRHANNSLRQLELRLSHRSGSPPRPIPVHGPGRSDAKTVTRQSRPPPKPSATGPGSTTPGVLRELVGKSSRRSLLQFGHRSRALG